MKKIIVFILSFFFSFCVGYALILHSLNTPLDIYLNREMNKLTVNQFGMFTAVRLDKQSFIFRKEIITVKEEPKEVVYEPQIMNIDFALLAESISDKNMIRPVFPKCITYLSK